MDVFCILDAFDGCAPDLLFRKSFTVLDSSGHPKTNVNPSSCLKPLHFRLLDAIAGEFESCLDQNEVSSVRLMQATPATPASKPVPPDYLGFITAVIPSPNISEA
jgi:hypothetical protein